MIRYLGFRILHPRIFYMKLHYAIFSLGHRGVKEEVVNCFHSSSYYICPSKLFSPRNLLHFKYCISKFQTVLSAYAFHQYSPKQLKWLVLQYVNASKFCKLHYCRLPIQIGLFFFLHISSMYSSFNFTFTPIHRYVHVFLRNGI